MDDVVRVSTNIDRSVSMNDRYRVCVCFVVCVNWVGPIVVGWFYFCLCDVGGVINVRVRPMGLVITYGKCPGRLVLGQSQEIQPRWFVVIFSR